MSRDDLSIKMGLRRNMIDRLCHAVENPDVRSISQLASQRGIGLVSIEKSFRYLMANGSEEGPAQQSLL